MKSLYIICIPKPDKIISVRSLFCSKEQLDKSRNEFPIKLDVSIKSLLPSFLRRIEEQFFMAVKIQENFNFKYCKIRVCSTMGKYIPLKQYHLISTFISGFKKFVLENIDLKQTFILFNLKKVYNYGFDSLRLGTIRGECTFYFYDTYPIVG